MSGVSRMNLCLYCMSRSERHDGLEAKQKELKNWIDHDVYEEVEDKGQNFISVTWVITEANFRWAADC